MPESARVALVPWTHSEYVGPFPQGRASVLAGLWLARPGVAFLDACFGRVVPTVPERGVWVIGPPFGPGDDP